MAGGGVAGCGAPFGENKMCKQLQETRGGRQVKAHRWYFGGLASAGAAVFTHPLDLLKASLWLGYLSVV